ncbi:unnamed protein product [Chrysoparadoxa australica]
MHVANTPLPKCPREAGCLQHWLVVQGKQPRIPQNPLPGSRDFGSNGVKEEVEVIKEAEQSKAKVVEVVPEATHQLSDEIKRYLERIKETTRSEEKAQWRLVFASLAKDPGLQEVLPYLCQYLQEQIGRCVQVTKQLSQLEALVAVIRAILSNPNFHCLECYLHQILPALMTVILHKGYTNALEEDHWTLRQDAANLVAQICRRYSSNYAQMQSRLTAVLTDVLNDASGKGAKRSMSTQFGALAGLTALGPEVVESLVVPDLGVHHARFIKALAQGVAKADLKRVMEAQRCLGAITHAAGVFCRYQQCQLVSMLPKKSVKRGRGRQSRVSQSHALHHTRALMMHIPPYSCLLRYNHRWSHASTRYRS